MDFDLTEEQRLLREGISRLLSETYGFAQRRRIVDEPRGWSSECWQRFAEMGLLGLPFAEAQGGFGGGPAETMIVMQAFGEALVVEPYLATVVLGGGFLRIAGTGEQCTRLVPGIAAGTLTMAFAQAEALSRYDLSYVETCARRDGEGWAITGAKRHVLGGDSADFLVVSARTDGEVDAEDGIGLFLVPTEAAGVSRRGYRLQDHTRAAEVRFDQVRVGPEDLIGEAGRGYPVMRRVVDFATTALCCEAVGAMSSLYERTIDYLKIRKQFGATIGSFQAIQHRAVEMFVELELARSISSWAITACDSTDIGEGARIASAAKIKIGRAARLIGQEAIQLHGGIGMTEEYPAGHYFRRLTMIELMFGDTRHHLAALATADGLEGA